MARNTFNRFITKQDSTERVSVSHRWSTQNLAFLVVWVLLQSILGPLTAHAHANQRAAGHSHYQAARRVIEEATGSHSSVKTIPSPVTVPSWANTFARLTIFFGVLSHILLSLVSLSHQPSLHSSNASLSTTAQTGHSSQYPLGHQQRTYL